ncbi:MAG TPA: transglutaminase domain-containing protein [Chloroflexota bacterium]|nr:transglutaminase domain-containing protein [Chloroflexota bacterium]
MSTILRPTELRQPDAAKRAAGPRSDPPGAAGAKLLERLSPPQGWLAVLGFAAAAEAMAGSLAAAHWQPGLTGLPWLVGLAVALGFLFTRGRRVNWVFWAFGLAVGLAVSVELPASGFLSGTFGWAQQFFVVLGQLVTWVQKSLGGRITQEDILISLAIAGFAYFWVYLNYLLAVRLRLGWLGAGLLGAPLFGNVMFKPASGGVWLALWAAGSLAMALSVGLHRRERFYRRLAFSGWRGGSRVALAGGLAMAALATVAFAFAPPVKVNQKLNELYQKLNGPIGQAQRAYEQLGVPKQYDASQIRFDTFQARLRFLGPFRPGTALVMKIRSSRGRYEQGLVFDHYDRDGWTNTRFNTFQSNSSEFSTLTGQQETSRDRDRQQVAEEVIAVRPAGALLFAPPQPLGASIRLKGDGFGDLRATATVQPNQLYTSAALESTATAEALAAATGPIPASVSQPFMELPPDLPARIKQLAEQQTSGKLSAYDKATALEAYLRTFPFDTETPPPPAGRDGVDWFLFDLRRGYSDYSSSAMAVMLRTLGIPSRVAAGYTPGQLDPTDGLYHVTEKDTHTWTQAYFPGYGWIDFEPSPDNPAFPRSHNPREQPTAGAASKPQPTPEQNATPTPGPGAGASPSGGGAGGGGSRFPWWLLLIAAGVLGAGGYFYSRLRGAPGARLAYMRVALTGTLLGMRPHSWQTPREYGRELQARRRFDRGATETIIGLYNADRYGSQRLDERGNRRAWTAWRYLKGRLLRPWRRERDSGS